MSFDRISWWLYTFDRISWWLYTFDALKAKSICLGRCLSIMEKKLRQLTTDSLSTSCSSTATSESSRYLTNTFLRSGLCDSSVTNLCSTNGRLQHVAVHIYVARLLLLINDTRRGHNTRQPSPSCWNFLSMVIPFDSFMHSDVYVQCVLIHVHFSLLVPLTSWSVDCDCYTRLSVIPLHRYLFLFRSYPSHCCWDLFLGF